MSTMLYIFRPSSQLPRALHIYIYIYIYSIHVCIISVPKLLPGNAIEIFISSIIIRCMLLVACHLTPSRITRVFVIQYHKAHVCSGLIAFTLCILKHTIRLNVVFIYRSNPFACALRKKINTILVLYFVYVAIFSRT